MASAACLGCHFHHRASIPSDLGNSTTKLAACTSQSPWVTSRHINRGHQDQPVRESHLGRRSVWAIYCHLLRLNLPIYPEHAPDCPSSFSICCRNHLGPFVVVRWGCQVPALDYPPLWLLNRQDCCRHCDGVPLLHIYHISVS